MLTQLDRFDEQVFTVGHLKGDASAPFLLKSFVNDRYHIIRHLFF